MFVRIINRLLTYTLLGEDMKRSVLFFSAAVVFSMAFAPAAVNSVFSKSHESTVKNAQVITENGGEFQQSTDLNSQTSQNSGQSAVIENEDEFEEYIVGVVAAEMPALYEQEALKAQAVAARTYAARSLQNGNTVDDLIKSGGQAYNTVEEMQEKWGSNFDTYYNKIKSAVDETKGEIMVYNGEPILAAFHAISSGKTETAENVWENDEPYLQSVESPMDTTAEDYTAQTVMTEEEVISKLQAQKPELSVAKGGFASQTQVIERSEAGYIQTIQIGNVVFTGRQVREILGLRSSDFTITQSGENVIFTTKGYGHGAGMSQYGANALAQEGKGYKEILEYYYTDISFENGYENK